MTDRRIEPLRAAPARSQAEEWALLLASQGISCAVRAERGEWVVWVESAQREHARRLLEQAESEPPPAEALPPAPTWGASLAGLWVAGALALFALHTGPAASGSAWFRRGTAHAAALLGGEYWRAITALTLHLDAAHVVANALSSGLFVTWAARRLGSGVGLCTVLASGALGNLANALWQGGSHRSIGASTALFGALGVLSGLEAGRRLWAGVRIERAWLPLAAGLALLAMLGTGRGSDVSAHAFGLVAGAALGLPLARGTRMAGPPVQVACGGLALVALLGAWWLAFSA